MTLLVLCLHLSVLIDISIKGGYQLIYIIYKVDKHMYRYYSSMPTTADTSLGTSFKHHITIQSILIPRSLTSFPEWLKFN